MGSLYAREHARVGEVVHYNEDPTKAYTMMAQNKRDKKGEFQMGQLARGHTPITL